MRSALVFLLLSGVARASTIVALSCSRTDVQNAVNASSSGDIIQVPAGSATWATPIATTKSLQFLGSGGGAVPTASVVTAYTTYTGIVAPTTIITGPTLDATLSITPAGDTFLTRVSGFEWVKPDTLSGTESVYVQGPQNAAALTKIRIDHNKFTAGTRAIHIVYSAWGVADHNYFNNCNQGVSTLGAGNWFWNNVTIAAGTANAFFCETNLFIRNNSELSDLGTQIYNEQGALSVARYNTFDGSSLTTGEDYAIFETHGNQDYFTTSTGSGFRGQPIIEWYNNAAITRKSNQFFLQRGGSVLIHDNTCVVTTGTVGRLILLREEEANSTPFSPFRTVWPAEDQVMNSFYWNNAVTGTVTTTVELADPATTATFIQVNRDYWLAAPASSGGSESWTGFAGGSSTAPTAASASTMTSTGAGANAYYPYTPYTYPHPLVNDAATSSSSISGKVTLTGKVTIR